MTFKPMLICSFKNRFCFVAFFQKHGVQLFIKGVIIRGSGPTGAAQSMNHGTCALQWPINVMPLLLHRCDVYISKQCNNYNWYINDARPLFQDTNVSEAVEGAGVQFSELPLQPVVVLVTQPQLCSEIIWTRGGRQRHHKDFFVWPW